MLSQFVQLSGALLRFGTGARESPKLGQISTYLTSAVKISGAMGEIF